MDLREQQEADKQLTLDFMAGKITGDQYEAGLRQLNLRARATDPMVAQKLSAADLAGAELVARQAGESAGVKAAVAGMGVEAQEAEALGTIYRTQQQELQRAAEIADDDREMMRANVASMAKDYQNAITEYRKMDVDPHRAFSGENTWRGVVGIIAGALGGISSAITGGPNVALQTMYRIQEADIAAQRNAIERAGKVTWHKRGILYDLNKKLGNVDVAEAAARDQINEMTRLKMLELGARTKSPMMQERIKGLVAQHEAKSTADKLAHYKILQAQAERPRGVAPKPKPTEPLPGGLVLLREEEAARYVPGLGLVDPQTTGAEINLVRKKKAEIDTFIGYLDELKLLAEQYPAGITFGTPEARKFETLEGNLSAAYGRAISGLAMPETQAKRLDKVLALKALDPTRALAPLVGRIDTAKGMFTLEYKAFEGTHGITAGNMHRVRDQIGQMRYIFEPERALPQVELPEERIRRRQGR